MFQDKHEKTIVTSLILLVLVLVAVLILSWGKSHQEPYDGWTYEQPPIIEDGRKS